MDEQDLTAMRNDIRAIKRALFHIVCVIEQHDPQADNVVAGWLAQEANAARQRMAESHEITPDQRRFADALDALADLLGDRPDVIDRPPVSPMPRRRGADVSPLPNDPTHGEEE